MLLLCRFFLGVLVPCQTYRCPSGSRVAESRPSRIALKGKGELVRMADEKEVSKQCRVGAEAVSLALRAHLWNEVYVKSVPDNPGPVAHTRKPRVPCSTHMTVHPSGTCHLSRQVIAGEGRREAAWSVTALHSQRPSFAALANSHQELGTGGPREASLLQAPKLFLLPSWRAPPQALDPILYCQEEGHTLGPGCPESPRGPASPGSPRDP